MHCRLCWKVVRDIDDRVENTAVHTKSVTEHSSGAPGRVRAHIRYGSWAEHDTYSAEDLFTASIIIPWAPVGSE